MKNIAKILITSSILLSINTFAGLQYPDDGTLKGTTYKPTLKEINLCADWSCAAPFNLFTGNHVLNVTFEGVEEGSDVSLNPLPKSGTYGYIQLKFNKVFTLNGYGRIDTSPEKWCATGYAGTLSTEADAITEVKTENASLDFDGTWLKPAAHAKGNNVDPYGRIKYGTDESQISIGGGYKDRADGVNTSSVNKYTFILKGSDATQTSDFYMTTVLQGGYVFSKGTKPKKIEFGISIDKMMKFDYATCVVRGAEPIFDFIIQ